MHCIRPKGKPHTSILGLCRSVEYDLLVPGLPPHLVVVLHAAGFVWLGLLHVHKSGQRQLIHINKGTRLTRICGSLKYSTHQSKNLLLSGNTSRIPNPVPRPRITLLPVLSENALSSSSPFAIPRPTHTYSSQPRILDLKRL